VVSALASQQLPVPAITAARAGVPASLLNVGVHAHDGGQDAATPAKDRARPDASDQAQADTAVPVEGSQTADAHGEPAQPDADSRRQTVSGTAEADMPFAGAPHMHAERDAASLSDAADAETAQGPTTVEAPSANAQPDAARQRTDGVQADKDAPSTAAPTMHMQRDSSGPRNASIAVAATEPHGSSASPQASPVHGQLEAAGQPTAIAASAGDDAPLGSLQGLEAQGELPRTLMGSKRAAKRQRRRQREAAARRAAVPGPAPTSLELAAVLPATAALLPRSSRAAKRARTQ